MVTSGAFNNVRLTSLKAYFFTRIYRRASSDSFSKLPRFDDIIWAYIFCASIIIEKTCIPTWDNVDKNVSYYVVKVNAKNSTIYSGEPGLRSLWTIMSSSQAPSASHTSLIILKTFASERSAMALDPFTVWKLPESNLSRLVSYFSIMIPIGSLHHPRSCTACFV